MHCFMRLLIFVFVQYQHKILHVFAMNNNNLTNVIMQAARYRSDNIYLCFCLLANIVFPKLCTKIGKCKPVPSCTSINVK